MATPLEAVQYELAHTKVYRNEISRFIDQLEAYSQANPDSLIRPVLPGAIEAFTELVRKLDDVKARLTEFARQLNGD